MVDCGNSACSADKQSCGGPTGQANIDSLLGDIQASYFLLSVGSSSAPTPKIDEAKAALKKSINKAGPELLLKGSQ